MQTNLSLTTRVVRQYSTSAHSNRFYINYWVSGKYALWKRIGVIKPIYVAVESCQRMAYIIFEACELRQGEKYFSIMYSEFPIREYHPINPDIPMILKRYREKYYVFFDNKNTINIPRGEFITDYLKHNLLIDLSNDPNDMVYIWSNPGVGQTEKEAMANSMMNDIV